MRKAIKLIPIEKNFRELTTREDLERVGHQIDAEQFLELLNSLQPNDSDIWKLSPILIGLTPTVFRQSLLNCSESQLPLLQINSVLESLHHRITLANHEIHLVTLETCLAYDRLDDEIARAPLDDFSEKQITQWTEEADELSEKMNDTMTFLDRILFLAWQVSRSDIIGSLSHDKELIERYLSNAPIVSFIRRRMESVFGNPNDPTQVNALQDHEPATEGLAILGIIYPMDYWEIGLLPHVIDASQIKDHVEKIYPTIKENLAKIGLNAVGDLKKAGIFSRAALEKYIANHL